MTDDAAPGDKASRRATLAGQAAELVLQNGLGNMGLRGLARQLQTSDRMLLYYFGTKEALVIETLARVGEKFRSLLGRYSDGRRLPPGRFVAQVLAMGRDPAVAPYMRVWTELIARAAAGEAPYGTIAQKAVSDWLAWIESRLVPDPAHPERPAALLSIIEGVTFLEIASPGVTRQVEQYLTQALDAQ